MGAKKGKRTKRKTASRSTNMFIQDLYSKNPILVVGGAVLLVLVVGMFLLGGLGSSSSQAEDILAGADTQTEEVQPPVNAVYGRITKIGGGTLEVLVEVGESTVPFSFTYNESTPFVMFAYANENDLVGSETSISSGSLSLGDMVSVYTEETPSTAAPQLAVRVVHTQ